MVSSCHCHAVMRALLPGKGRLARPCTRLLALTDALLWQARKRAPAVVFIDELDAVGARRGAGMNEERDQTLNQLLTELDGFEGRQGILLLAATNRPEARAGPLSSSGAFGAARCSPGWS